MNKSSLKCYKILTPITNMFPVRWEDFARYLFTERKLDKSCTTTYKGRFKKIAFYFSDTAITRHGINLFCESLQEEGYKTATINAYIKFLKHVCKYLANNATDDITFYKAPQTYVDVLTPQEIEGILKNLTGRFSVAIELLARTGMRSGELTALTWDDFKGDRLILRDTKNGTMRQVPLLPDLALKIKALPKLKNSYIFGSVNGGMNRCTLNEKLREAGKKAGITKKLYCHVLRHSFVTESIRGGAKLPPLADLVGHKNINTTMGYTHMVIEDLADVARIHPLSQPHVDARMVLAAVKDVLTKYKNAPVNVKINENNEELVVTIKKSA